MNFLYPLLQSESIQISDVIEVLPKIISSIQKSGKKLKGEEKYKLLEETLKMMTHTIKNEELKQSLDKFIEKDLKYIVHSLVFMAKHSKHFRRVKCW